MVGEEVGVRCRTCGSRHRPVAAGGWQVLDPAFVGMLGSLLALLWGRSGLEVGVHKLLCGGFVGDHV